MKDLNTGSKRAVEKLCSRIGVVMLLVFETMLNNLAKDVVNRYLLATCNVGPEGVESLPSEV